VRQVKEDLKNNFEKGISIRNNIQRIFKKRVSLYLYPEEIIHEVSRAD